MWNSGPEWGVRHLAGRETRPERSEGHRIVDLYASAPRHLAAFIHPADLTLRARAWSEAGKADHASDRRTRPPQTSRLEALPTQAEVVSLKEKIKALRKTDAKADAVEALETRIKEQEKAARDLLARSAT
jgi:hypothetical protein